MSKRLIMLFALVFVVSFAVPVFAAVQNVKVSGDLLMRGVSRTRFGLTDSRAGATTIQSAAGQEDQSYLDTVARLRLDADLTDGVSAVIRTITERAWGQENQTANNTDLDLDLAYVTLKDALNFITEVNIPLTVMIGRQELHYGNDLIIGDVDTNGVAPGTTLPYGDLSLRKSFDAIRGILDYSPLVIDLVYAKVDENSTARYRADKDDVDLYGINANYTGISDLVLEGYGWLRHRDKSVFTAANSGSNTPSIEDENTYTIGARGQYSGITIADNPLIVGLEGAYQFGNLVASSNIYPQIVTIYGFTEDESVDRSAIAIQGGLSYTWQKAKYTPTLAFDYTYLSGQVGGGPEDPYEAWDSMFENQAGGTIFNAIFGYSNSQFFHVTGSCKPIEDMLLKLEWYFSRLNRNFRAGQSVNLSGVAGSDQFRMGEGKSLFQEVDANLIYDYTEDVQLGLNAASLIPGNAFADDTYDIQPAYQVIGSMKVTF